MSETPAEAAQAPAGSPPGTPPARHGADAPPGNSTAPVVNRAAGPPAAGAAPAGEADPDAGTDLGAGSDADPSTDTDPGTAAANADGPGPRPARRGRMAPPTASRSWFGIGFAGGLGVVVAWLLVRTVLRISELLTLLLLSVFIAVSLEPLVAWLTRHGLRRGWSVAAVVAAFAGLLAGFTALVIPPVTAAVGALSDAVPRWRGQLHDHHSTLGRLEDRYHLIEKTQAQLGSGGGASKLAGGVLGAGQLVISAVTSTVIVITVTLYVMMALPAIKKFCYRFVPGTRRERVESVTETILARVGRFMLGNIATSVIAGVATFVWCAVIGVPYPAALGFFVALMDMIPVVGSTVGGVVVSLVALSESLPVAVATAGFYIGFRLAEDYLIMPRAMKFAVNVHPVVTVVAVLAGGSLLGIIGGLVAIPAAVALGIVLDEFVFPRTDTS